MRVGRPQLVAASAALVVALSSGAVWFLSILTGFAVRGWLLGAWSGPATLVLVVPLVVVATAGILREDGAIGRRAVVLLPLLALVAAVGIGAAEALWTVGFDAADEGRTPPDWIDPLTRWSLLDGLLATAALLAWILLAVLRLARLGRAAMLAVALPVGAVAAPVLVIAAAITGPVVQILAAAGALAVVLVHRAPRGRPSRPAPAPPLRVPDGTAAGLALLGVAVGVAAVVLAFAGGSLEWFGMDGTAAMRAGLLLGTAGGLPVALAIGLLLRGRPFRRAVVALLIAGLLASASSGVLDGGQGSGVLVLGAGLAGALVLAAVALVLHPLLVGPAITRSLLAALIVVAGVPLVGVLLGAALGVVAPVAGVVLALLARPRRAATLLT